MKTKNLIFKLGIIVAAIGELCLLGGIMFIAISEYDPTHIETFGIIITAVSAALASFVFLALIFYVLKLRTA